MTNLPCRRADHTARFDETQGVECEALPPRITVRYVESDHLPGRVSAIDEDSRGWR